MMVQPVSPLGSTNGIYESQSPQEKQKNFEIQFQSDVLGTYLSVTRKNGALQDQLSKIKKGLGEGKSPDQLATDLNSLIIQINQTEEAGKTPFPAFSFSTEGSQAQALTQFVNSLKKALDSADIKSQSSQDMNAIQKLFGDLSSLVNNVGQMTPEQAFGDLNRSIAGANKLLPKECQISTIPLERGGRR